MTFTPDFSRFRLWAGAALLLLLAACGDPPPPPPSVETAKEALRNGDALGAEIILRGLLDGGTPREELAAYLGEAELGQGELAEARRWLGDGEFSEGTSGHGFHMLGRLELREGNLPAAGQAFDRAYGFIPDDSNLWVDIGRLRYRGGEQLPAVKASIKAVELGPDNPAALQFRGQLVRDAEGMLAALSWFERAVEQNPNNLDLLGDYAATLGELGRARDMLQVVRRMTELDPRNPRAYYLQAVLAARAGNYDLARRLLQLTNQAHRDMPAAMLLSGIIDMRSGNYASASQEFDRLARLQPDNRRVRLLLARSLALEGSHRELAHRFGEAALLPSASPYLATLVGRAHEAMGQREQAAIYLDHATHPRTDNLIAVPGVTPLAVVESRGVEHGKDALSLVRGLIVSGQREAAAARGQAFRARYPGSADALSLAGDAELAARRIGPALELYEQSARVRRPWLLTRRMIAALDAAGRRNDALALLRSHVAGDPNNVEAVAMLARRAFDRQDFAQAALLLDHAMRSGGGRDPLLVSLRAEAALRSGETELALVMARQAYGLQRMNGVATNILGVALAQAGDQQGANALMAKASKLGD
ncbi:MAG: tetratricopeptide repeat protein [Sphingomonadaceae bacterium]|nr:tetratricopeptide repeat protein [Sphingomonadaceae bacterium]